MGPVELDKVTIVARDCLLAYVECQIIVTILQGVTAQFPCRWDEILEFRRTHIGSPEQATRTLLYQKNQLHFAQTQQRKHKKQRDSAKFSAIQRQSANSC